MNVHLDSGLLSHLELEAPASSRSLGSLESFVGITKGHCAIDHVSPPTVQTRPTWQRLGDFTLDVLAVVALILMESSRLPSLDLFRLGF